MYSLFSKQYLYYYLRGFLGLDPFFFFSQNTPTPRGVRDAVRVMGHFQHRTLRCGLTKTITTLHLIFAITCAVWCGLEFSQNHNRTAPYFCGHICGTMYMIRFEINIFFKFWTFPTQPKTNFSLFFGPNFELLSQFFFILD